MKNRTLAAQQELRDYLIRLPSLLEDMKRLSDEGAAYVAEVLGEYEEELWRRAMVQEYTEEDQIWRDEVVAEYTRLTLRAFGVDPNNFTMPEGVETPEYVADMQTCDLLNEAIRDSINIPRMRRNYGNDLGI